MAGTLVDAPVPVRYKLAALWTSVMFCYIYADYFGLYVPPTVQQMLAGRMPPFGPAGQGVLLGTSIMMIIPSLMIFLSVGLRPAAARWANVVFGLVYTLIILLTMPGQMAYYLLFGAIEAVMTLMAAWIAWSWPRLIPAGS